LSDLGRRIATPMETIARSRFAQDAAHLVRVVAEQRVGGLVIGLPINMDGSSGPRAQSTRQFARNLATHIDLPMLLWDERLSTAAVTRTLLEADASRARRKVLVDKLAAAYILQGALDRLARL
jgi:putative Holliday junction resolvase